MKKNIIVNKLNLQDVVNNADEHDTHITVVLTPGWKRNTRAEKVFDELQTLEVRIDLIWTGYYGWLAYASCFHGYTEDFEEIETQFISGTPVAEEESFEWRLNRCLNGVLPTLRKEVRDYLPPWMH